MALTKTTGLATVASSNGNETFYICYPSDIFAAEVAELTTLVSGTYNGTDKIDVPNGTVIWVKVEG
jgi:hypothetical protein